MGEALLEHGARYIGLDISWPYILEFNIVSPAGLPFVELMIGVNHAGAVVDAVLAHCRLGQEQPIR